MNKNDLPEWYTVIKNCLREYECFDMKMFVENGGQGAYAMLDMKLQQEKTLIKLADIRTRDAVEHPVERTEPGLTVTEDDPSELDVVYCSDCGTQEAYANGLCADCLIGTPQSD